MSAEPRPLPEGTLLAERFEVEGLLGRGAFGIVYLAHDLTRNDHVVVKELAPTGTTRRDDNLIQLPADSAHRMRQNFLNEAKTISRLHVRGILPVRLGFAENGTAYFATDYLPNAETLEKLMQKEGRMEVDGALDILYQCLEILEAIHEKGVLHRDIKPSNILLNANGEVTLIDFGAAREWQADSATTHTVLFTPSYAPLEQMAERARRGPASDLFALCATAYEMLTGRKPETATDRASGTSLTPIDTLRPEVEPAIAESIETGMALKYTDRPQSIAAFRELLAKESEPHGPQSLFELDARMVRLQRFSFERRECPACKGLLEEPRPLRKGICPVCHEGTIRQREIHPHQCPICRTAIMKRIHNLDPIRTCPSCKKGWLQIRKKGLLSKEIQADCPNCNASFVGDKTSANGKLWQEWLLESGRSEYVWFCDSCSSQLDEQGDDRLLLQASSRPSSYLKLYPEEWDCVAAGLEPGSGNAECVLCDSDYYMESENVTLLACKDDPFGYAKSNLGRLLTLEDNRWMAVGKVSPHPGLVCQQCHTEFDKDGDYLRLVRSPNRRLLHHLDEPNKLPDWHRIAQDLPTIDEEPLLTERLLEQITASYKNGDIGFDDGNSILWKGPAVNLDSNAAGTLTISKTEFQFGGVFKKSKLPFDTIRSCRIENGALYFLVRGESEPFPFQVETIDLTVALQSGRYTVELGMQELADRVNKERAG